MAAPMSSNACRRIGLGSVSIVIVWLALPMQTWLRGMAGSAISRPAAAASPPRTTPQALSACLPCQLDAPARPFVATQAAKVRANRATRRTRTRARPSVLYSRFWEEIVVDNLLRPE